MSSNIISPTLQSKNYLEEMKKAGKKVFNFGLGQNPVLQPYNYIKGVIKHSSKKDYTSCQGVPELNSTLKKIYDTPYTKYEILTGNGLKELLFVVQCAFRGKIIHITPSWVSYKEHIEVLKREDDLIEIPTTIQNNYRVDLGLLEKTLKEIGDVPKLLLFNNPNNPTGICYRNHELEELALLLKKYNCVVFSDEIYLNLCYHENQKSISSYIPELTIKGSSVSKDLACGGYRLGWCAFPKELESLFLECCSCASRVYSCTATPIQYATADMLLKDEECDKYVNEMITLFRHIKTQLLPLLKNTKLKYADVDAAWYVYINFENYKKELINIGIHNSVDLGQYLMKHYQIITVAGEHFSDESMSLRFSLVDFEFDLENKSKTIEEVNISNMIDGFKQLIKFLDDICE